MSQLAAGGHDPVPEAQPKPHVADRVAGWVLFGLQAVLTVLLSFVGFMWWSLIGLGCGDAPTQACEDFGGEDAIVAWSGYAVLLPWIPLGLALVGIIIQLVRRRLIWWIPLIGAVGAVGIFVLLIAYGGTVDPS